MDDGIRFVRKVGNNFEWLDKDDPPKFDNQSNWFEKEQSDIDEYHPMDNYEEDYVDPFGDNLFQMNDLNMKKLFFYNNMLQLDVTNG